MECKQNGYWGGWHDIGVLRLMINIQPTARLRLTEDNTSSVIQTSAATMSKKIPSVHA